MKIKQHLVSKIPILGGKCHIYRNSRSGEIWQFQQWIKDEHRYIRISLRAKDRQVATELAEKQFASTLGRIHSGEKIFSITAKELVAQYLKHLDQRVAFGSIRVTFPQIVKSHLKHYLAFVKEDTKIQSIPAEKFRDYAHTRRSKKIGRAHV